VTVYDDRTFDLRTRTPPTSALLARAAGLPKGGGRPGSDAPVAKLGRDRLREIARTKLPDLNTTDLDAAERIVAGTARSMGIELVDG
jgi:large subunit ribosomal protein L11